MYVIVIVCNISVVFLRHSVGQTCWYIFALDGSSNAESLTSVPFGVFVDTVFNLGGQMTKPNFWGVNRHIKAKRAKY